MAANTTPVFSLTPFDAGLTFASTDTTTRKTVYTAGTNGSRVDGLVVSTSDTAAVNLAFWINDTTTDYYIGVVTVPIGSGYTTVVRVDALATLAPPGFKALVLKAGYLLKCNCVATMSAAVTTTVVAIGGDF